MSVAPKNRPTGPQGGSDEVDQDDEDAGRPRSSPAKPAEMSDEVVEFIQAIDEYKRLQQRPFPTWSEVLDVLKSLGYSKPE